jgi:hypothetical protein
MPLNIVITIDSVSQNDVKDLRDTANYLLALSGASLAQVVEVPFVTDENRKSPSSDVDADGITWDYKIHSSTKAKNKDGRWKLKRNVEPEVATPAPVVVPPPPAEDLLGKFMSKVTEKIVSGRMTHNSLSAFLSSNGIPDVPSIQNFPHLLPDLIKKIEVLV